MVLDKGIYVRKGINPKRGYYRNVGTDQKRHKKNKHIFRKSGSKVELFLDFGGPHPAVLPRGHNLVTLVLRDQAWWCSRDQ